MSSQEDEALLQNADLPPVARMAAHLRLGERRILDGAAAYAAQKKEALAPEAPAS